MKKILFSLLLALAASTTTVIAATAKPAAYDITEVRRILCNKYKLNEHQMIAIRPALLTYLESADKASAEVKFKDEFTKVTGKSFTGF